jgi:hypothetical protein
MTLLVHSPSPKIIITKPSSVFASLWTKVSFLHHHTSQLLDSKTSLLCHYQAFKHISEVQNVVIPFCVRQMWNNNKMAFIAKIDNVINNNNLNTYIQMNFYSNFNWR